MMRSALLEPSPHVCDTTRRCECRGECGLDHPRRHPTDAHRCAVPDGMRIMRSVDYPKYWYYPMGLWMVSPLEAEAFRPDGLQKLETTQTPTGPRLLCPLCRTRWERV